MQSSVNTVDYRTFVNQLTRVIGGVTLHAKRIE
jgi:hypothetical protein